jgi:hypothetical protein
MATTSVYEISHDSTLHQDGDYTAMLSYCQERGLDSQYITTRYVDIPDTAEKYLMISSYLPSTIPGFITIYNPLNADDLSGMDYDLRGYHKKRTFVYGELKVVEYYKYYSMLSNTYTGLVVREERKYVRDTRTGLCYARQMDIYWYLNDGSVGHSILSRMKFLSFSESMQELRDRRTNLFSDAESAMLYLLNESFPEAATTMRKAVELKQAIKKEKDLYIDGVAENILTLIAASNNIIDTVFTDAPNQAAAPTVKYVLTNILNYDFTAQID